MKFVKAYVELILTGQNVERFLNLCVFHDIVFKQIEDDGKTFRCVLSVEDFYKIKEIIRKTGVKVVISGRYGLPFLFQKMVKRTGLIWGIGLLLCLMVFSQKILWSIEVHGLEVVTNHQILDVIEKQQVHVGMFLSEIDYVALEEAVRGSFPGIVWCSVSQEENRLQVFVKEKEPEHDKPTTEADIRKLLGISVVEGDGFTNLVADRDFTIDSMVIRKGFPGVTSGEVKPGDVLVYGQIPVFADDGTVKTYLMETASAQITVTYQQEYDDKLDNTYVKKEYTGREGYGFLFQGKEYSFREFGQYDSEQVCRLFQQLCPITIVRYKEYHYVEYRRSDAEMENILYGKLQDFLDGLAEKGIQIIAKDVTIKRNVDYSRLHGTLTLEGKFDE
ncbi:MAG: sporulation protein YqfD [Lachnospiraceae bacterium]|nr:sporulation protein YqfD [Lachnospiraceae bacterium]